MKQIRDTLKTALAFVLCLIFLDVSVNLLFPYPWDPNNISPGALNLYFDYGRSIEGKVLRQIGPTDKQSSPLSLAGWLDPKNWRDLPTKPKDGENRLMAAYGMSFSNQISETMQAIDPRWGLRLIAGPAAPPNHSFTAYNLDRGTCGADRGTCGADRGTCGADRGTCGADRGTCGADRGTCGADRGTCGADRGTCGADRGTCGADRGTCGADRGTCGADRGTCGADRGTCGADRGTCGADRGTCGADRGTCGADRGTCGADRGTCGADRGTCGADRGTCGADRGTCGADRGTCGADRGTCGADRGTCGADRGTCGADRGTCGADRGTCGADRGTCGADRENHHANVVLWAILASSVKSMESLTGMTSGSEVPPPFTFPRYQLDGKQLKAIWPEIPTLMQLRTAIQQKKPWQAFIEQLRERDGFFNAFVFEKNWLDKSTIARLIRRAYTQKFFKGVEATIHTSRGFNSQWKQLPVLREMVREFAETAKTDGRLPIVLLIHDRGYDDHLYQVLKTTLEKNQIPFVSTHTIASPQDIRNFVGDGHFTRQANQLIAKAVLAVINRSKLKPEN